MKNELFDLVQQAQNGNKDAMYEIITMFRTVIRNARYKLKADLQDDLEQVIVETIIKKVMAYDLTQAPDFSSFCRQLTKVYHG